MSDQDSEPVAAPEEAGRTAGIGLLLRKAREARGLTVADVVTALKYSPRQIEALEADEMPLLPGNVFMRGIVRSYARFLKLDPEPLLALLTAEAPETPPDVVPPEDMGVAMPRSGGHQISGLVAAAILITILAAAIAVWHSLAPPVASVAQTSPAATSPAATAAGSPESKSPGPNPPAMPEKTPVPVPVAPPELTSAPDTPIDRTETASAAGAQPAAVTGKQLAFDFHGTSWVEVKDASRHIIFTGQYGNGMHEVAQGQPPFQIIIGNAPLVDLTYEGHSVNLKPYIRADVARLSLE